ncbi:MAG TPA: site-specific integrase [Candidatus Dormibacteraeota bacterium]|nr:site-specific integrase [Candidatus Dormibacteraeota bacterium]
MNGPLAPWASGLAEHLKGLGYRPRTAARQMELVMGLSRYLQELELGASRLSSGVVVEFCRSLRQTSGSSRPTPKALAWVISYLQVVGAISAPISPAPPTQEAAMVERYLHYLATERGLAPGTIVEYGRTAALLLAEHPGRELDTLSVGDVSRFMTRQCRRLSAKSGERLGTGLRSFFAFAQLEGLITAPLAGAVLSVAHWSGASLPRGLAPGELAALLGSCDRRLPIGLRDYAILVLLSRLGLRACEAAALCLEDIEWLAGEIIVRGKGHTKERLPLPSDVGTAIVAYLHGGRPQRPEREVFLRVIAPVRGLSPDGVGEVVRTAAERAGIGSFGSHRLRHTAATEMLRAGASLPEVAQVLRHRSVATTTIYAKVDFLKLRGLAMPWPGGER